MLTLIAFSLLLLQSSLDEVFNPRLRRGKCAKRTRKAGRAATAQAAASAAPAATPVGASRHRRDPRPASTGGAR